MRLKLSQLEVEVEVEAELGKNLTFLWFDKTLSLSEV